MNRVRLAEKIIKIAEDLLEELELIDKIEQWSKKAQWEELPVGWTEESLRQFWDTLTGGKTPGEGGVSTCIEKIKDVYPDITDPGAFCASLADRIFGKDWRRGPRD